MNKRIFLDFHQKKVISERWPFEYFMLQKLQKRLVVPKSIFIGSSEPQYTLYSKKWPFTRSFTLGEVGLVRRDPLNCKITKSRSQISFLTNYANFWCWILKRLAVNGKFAKSLVGENFLRWINTEKRDFHFFHPFHHFTIFFGSLENFAPQAEDLFDFWHGRWIPPLPPYVQVCLIERNSSLFTGGFN